MEFLFFFKYFKIGYSAIDDKVIVYIVLHIYWPDPMENPDQPRYRIVDLSHNVWRLDQAFCNSNFRFNSCYIILIIDEIQQIILLTDDLLSIHENISKLAISIPWMWISIGTGRTPGGKLKSPCAVAPIHSPRSLAFASEVESAIIRIRFSI